jgi:alanine dehydrogenase
MIAASLRLLAFAVTIPAVTTLILTQAQIRALLPMRTCMDLMSEILAALARGEAHNPLRWAMKLPDGKSLLGLMPGSLGASAAFGLKAVAVLPGNHGTPYDSHQGVVVLFDAEHGVPRAILDASEVTAIRTAAASGVATRLLAREDAGDLALIGTGVEALTHLEAMAIARKIRRVRAFSRTRSNVEAFATLASKRMGIRVEPSDSARAAVEGADIVCTTTSSAEPILLGDWISPGAHVNAVGACTKRARELDSKAVLRSRLFVDRRESTLHESGDFLIPKSEGLFGDEHIRGEIGEILVGACAGRRSKEEITLFKSLGTAVEDLAVAAHLDRVAREKKIGTLVEFGGLRREAD